jgi:hypothetical protein
MRKVKVHSGSTTSSVSRYEGSGEFDLDFFVNLLAPAGQSSVVGRRLAKKEKKVGVKTRYGLSAAKTVFGGK